MTKQITFSFSLFLCLAFSLFFGISTAKAELRNLPHITILAASSMAEPVTEITRMYSRNNNISITVSYDLSSEQAKKIEDGNAADIFVSSDPVWISYLKQKGLLDVYSISNIVKNNLVFAISKESKLKPFISEHETIQDKLLEAAKRSIFIAGNVTDSPLGRYTASALNNVSSNIWNKLKKSTMQVDSSSKVAFLISQRKTGGIIYASDAHNNPDLEVIYTFAENETPAIIYQMAVVAGENMEDARNFLGFLQSSTSKSILYKYGFLTN